MADVTGPIHTLPGTFHKLPEGTMCDTHPKEPAVRRIQGETDSMGSEMIDCCAACTAEIDKHKQDVMTGTCDWCKGSATDLRNTRDYEEGSYGPIYQVCGKCRAAYYKRMLDELDERGY